MVYECANGGCGYQENVKKEKDRSVACPQCGGTDWVVQVQDTLGPIEDGDTVIDNQLNELKSLDGDRDKDDSDKGGYVGLDRDEFDGEVTNREDY